MERTVNVPARGKREAFSFSYDAVPFEHATKEQLHKAWFDLQDKEAVASRTTEVQEHKMLLAAFHGSLKYMSKTLGIEKAQEIILGAGGFETLTESEINETVDDIKNPKERKKRTPKTVAA